ncbi:hypothetical protein MPSEU_000854200 [Mayamaea pseudoterrestris]|nr:hypothetical protein MPSEU_000854200 [Mayamaea pseudoterrestris]
MVTPPRSPRSPSKQQRQQQATWNNNANVPPTIRTTTSSASYSSRLSFGKPSKRPLTESEEAELLSHATSQAMTAARSILMAGGSEATALSTAKAAATSILAPSSSDSEQGRSFLGRRKGKRQAEIVASMALLSVKQTMLQSNSGVGTSPGSLLPPSAQPAPSLAISTRTQSPATSTAAARPPLPTRAFSPLRRTPFQPPAAERHEAIGSSTKDQRLGMRRTPTPVPATTAEKGSGSQTTSSGASSTGPILPPTICTTPSSVLASFASPKQLTSKLPQELPKPRPKTRDIADNLPNEDPIYYNDASTVPRRRNLSPSSFSTTSSGSETNSSGTNSNTMTCETYEEDTVEAQAIAQAIAERKRITTENGADAFLTSLSDLILCGMGSTTAEIQALEAELAQSRDAPMNARSNSLNSRDIDESLHSSDSEDDDNETSSTVSSTEILQELNKASFDTKKSKQAMRQRNSIVQASSMTDSIRKTVEQAMVLAGTSPKSPKRAGRNESSAAKPVIEAREHDSSQPEQSTISLKYQPGSDDVSDLTTGKNNRLQVLSQRVKFRSWMRRRRGAEGGKLPLYE